MEQQSHLSVVVESRSGLHILSPTFHSTFFTSVPLLSPCEESGYGLTTERHGRRMVVEQQAAHLGKQSRASKFWRTLHHVGHRASVGKISLTSQKRVLLGSVARSQFAGATGRFVVRVARTKRVLEVLLPGHLRTYHC